MNNNVKKLNPKEDSDYFAEKLAGNLSYIFHPVVTKNIVKHLRELIKTEIAESKTGKST
jgi:hypothetical protein